MKELDKQEILARDVLIVDDEVANLKLLAHLLSRHGYQVRPAENPQLAIDSAISRPPSLILLDVKMPGLDGFEVCRRLKHDTRTSHIPIIFISALKDIEDKVRGFKAGGVDFITKPIQEEEVLARVRTHMDLHHMYQNMEKMVGERTAELARSEAKYRGLVDNALAGVFTTTLEGRFVFVNEAITHMFDFESREHMIAHHSTELWNDPQDRKRLLADLQKYGSVANFEAETITHAGRHIQIIFSAKQVNSNIVGMIMDITDRKIAEDNLRESEARFRSTFTQAAVGIAHVDLDGSFLRINQKFCDIVGYSQEKMVELTFQDITHPDDLNADLEYVQKLLRGEAANYSMEKRYFRQDGEVIWVDLTVSLLRKSDGEPNWFVSVIEDITDRKQAEIELDEAYNKIKKLQSQLKAESAYLQEEIKLEHNFEKIIGQSEPLYYVLHRVEMVAPQDSTVLILGETGTGKELIARAIHQLSSRNARPLLKINCAALPAELIESELFGREKGAFTGATKTQIGRFELANNSTIFLDEIGELPFNLQAKLLQVLESGQFERLGNPRTFHTDARIIAATNRNLGKEVEQKRFRGDLWYRLNIFPVSLPPLRARIKDIPLLVDHFLQLFSKKMGKKYKDLTVSQSSMRALQSYSWPGNVRELEHVVEAAIITMTGKKLYFDIPQIIATGLQDLKSFTEMEREYLLKVLTHVNWNVGGKNGASTILGMPVSTLQSRMKKLGIQRP